MIRELGKFSQGINLFPEGRAVGIPFRAIFQCASASTDIRVWERTALGINGYEARPFLLGCEKRNRAFSRHARCIGQQAAHTDLVYNFGGVCPWIDVSPTVLSEVG